MIVSSHRPARARAFAAAAVAFALGFHAAGPTAAVELELEDPLAHATVELYSAAELEAFLEPKLAEPNATLSSPHVVPFVAFRPATSGQSCDQSFGDAFLTTTATSATCCVVAPVSLPQGATVNTIVLWAHDNRADDFTISLRRKTLANTFNANLMATAATSGTGAGVRVFVTATISFPVVNNALYTYYLQSSPCLKGTAHRLYSVSIYYTP
jgi:hypothetical protein